MGQQAARQSGTPDGDQAVQLGNIYTLTSAVSVFDSMCLLCRMLQSHSAGLATFMRSVLHVI